MIKLEIIPQCHAVADNHQNPADRNHNGVGHVIDCRHNRPMEPEKTSARTLFASSASFSFSNFMNFFFLSAEYLYNLLSGNDFLQYARSAYQAPLCFALKYFLEWLVTHFVTRSINGMVTMVAIVSGILR